MPNLTLFSARACPFAHRTRLVLAEKKVDFELREIDLANKPAWFHDVSGYGKVPAIEHDGHRIWESAVINEYLDEVFPDPPLLPREPSRRAVARIWIDYANTRLAPAFGAVLRGPERERETARRDLEQILGYIEERGLARHAGDGPFFFGVQPTLVDFAFHPWFERWPALEHHRGLAISPALAGIARWRSALAELPSVKQHESSPDFYIERYAKLIAPGKPAVA